MTTTYDPYQNDFDPGKKIDSHVISTGTIFKTLKNPRVNPLSANPMKRSNQLKQCVGKLLTNCFSVFDHFVGLTLKGLNN